MSICTSEVMIIKIKFQLNLSFIVRLTLETSKLFSFCLFWLPGLKGLRKHWIKFLEFGENFTVNTSVTEANKMLMKRVSPCWMHSSTTIIGLLREMWSCDILGTWAEQTGYNGDSLTLMYPPTHSLFLPLIAWWHLSHRLNGTGISEQVIGEKPQKRHTPPRTSLNLLS